MRVLARLTALLMAFVLIGCSARSAPGEPVLRASAPPWPAPRDGLAQLQAAGLEASRLDDTSNQRRFTLVLTIDSAAVPLVPFIGMVTGVVGYVDVAWLLWDQRRQCLHDKIADTLVEQKPPTRRV